MQTWNWGEDGSNSQEACLALRLPWGPTASCFMNSIPSHKGSSQWHLALKLGMMKRGQMQTNATEKEKHPQGKRGQPWGVA